ncbi:MAG: hypothetical protein CVV42_07060 [Candidatus Riflebacteria bacterium HGW-Riflebacteria-2]|jgi:predicted DNA-binding protein (UPF0251 family)|nr:MAG: hypothetical protein CVV42_07060 [Candidatus Riflebacteria bacterium HGW-Riflebacteria-2]
MVRPRLRRRVHGEFGATYFKPAGIPVRELETVCLTFDEIEAIRLTDLEGLYQADAAEQMNVSRQTLGNIVNSAHKKLAEALIKGMAIKIEGGTIEYMHNLYYCPACESTFPADENEANCPDCKSDKIEPAELPGSPGPRRRRRLQGEK